MDTSTTSRKKQRSPLELPELLDLTFSFLNDYTITHTIILVCRQWFQVGQHRVIKELVWQSNRKKVEKDRVLSQLGRVDRLCYRAENFGYNGLYGDKNLWENLAERSRRHRFLDWEQRRARFSQPQQKQQEREDNGDEVEEELDTDQETSELPLKELRMQGTVGLCNMKEIYPAMAHLTSLEIRSVIYGILQMRQLFENCPLLQEICIESPSPTAQYLQGPWFSEVRTNPRTGQARKRAPLLLRSLVLRNLVVPQSCLETLIGVVPQLGELLLVIKDFVDLYGSTITTVSNDNNSDGDVDGSLSKDGPTRIRQLVKLHHPQLRSFYFSPPQSVAPDVIHDWIQDAPLSKRRDWTFEGPELTPGIVGHLVQLPNFITTLHISGECSTLHGYLCASPHLVHLKAPYTAISIDDLDIHHRLVPGRHPAATITVVTANQQQQQQGNNRPQVWACRRLQTLQVAFFSTNMTSSSSRVVFGYISRVCPKLKDLEIYGPEYLQGEWTIEELEVRQGRLYLLLEGGLCLLSRLKNLERLVVGNWYDIVTRVDEEGGDEDDGGDDDGHSGGGWAVHFDWMIPAGHSVTRRNARQAWINRAEGKRCWSKMLQDEEAQDKERLQNHQKVLSDHVVTTATQQVKDTDDGDEEGLATRLQDLGLLKDVKQVLDEMESSKVEEGEGYRCWPHLIRLSFYQNITFGQQPGAEVRRLLTDPQTGLPL